MTVPQDSLFPQPRADDEPFVLDTSKIRSLAERGGAAEKDLPSIFSNDAETNDRIMDILNPPSEVTPAAKDLGRVVCADCGQVIPCAHAGGGRTFGY